MSSSAAPATAEIPALSPSVAHTLLERSPLHAWTFHRLLGGKTRPTSKSQGMGTIYHALLLEGGVGLEVIDAPDFRSPAARAKRDAAIADGRTPLTRPQWESAQASVERIRERLAEQRIELAGGVAEARMEWTEPGRSGQVLCHGRLDYWGPGGDPSRVIDLKMTERSAHPEACAAAIVRSAAVIQAAAYPRAVAYQKPELSGRVEVLFVFVEAVEPFAVTPVLCDGSMLEVGAIRWRRAVDLWSDCLRRGSWPSYTHGATTVAAPTWALAREHGHEELGT